MGTTAKGIRYGELTDAPDGPTQEQQLAEDVDDLLTVPSRQLARSGSLTVGEATWTAVPGYGAGNLYTTGDVTYPGSGIVQVGTAGLYDWDFTGLWREPTAIEFRGVKIQVGGSDPTYLQGAHFGSFGSTVGGAVYFPWTAGGKIALAASDLVQAFVWSSGTGSGTVINSLVFALTRVA